MPGFALVVNRKNEILLVQRGYGASKGKWSLPGGRRDKGESLRCTAIRETREETGIKTSADSLYLHSSKNNFEVWRGRYLEGKLHPQKRECLDAKWFQVDMLPHADNLAFGPDKIVIKKWAGKNPRKSASSLPSPKDGQGWLSPSRKSRARGSSEALGRRQLEQVSGAYQVENRIKAKAARMWP